MIKHITILIFVFLLLTIVIKADWVQVSNGITQPNINALTASGNYIFAGTNYTFQGGGVFVTTNNGINWSISGVYMQTLSLASNGNYIYAGTPTSFYRSTNYGANWSLTSLGRWTTAILTTGNYVYAGCFYPSHNTNNGVWVSTNNGVNWTETPLNNVDIYTLTMSGSYLFAGGNGIFLSTNNGANWQLSTNIGAWSLASNGSFIYAGGGGVIVSTNYGANWTQTSLNNESIYSLAVYGNNIFAGGSIFVSTNNGLNWTQRIEGMSGNYVVRSLCITNNYLFAGTDGYGVWRRPLSELVGIEPISNIVPEEFKLFQNYPNPFNPVTKIKFDIPSNLKAGVKRETSNVKLIIYDIIGKEIEMLVNEQLKPGNYEVDWNASGYSCGVYFYKLIAGNQQSETKKMIINK